MQDREYRRTYHKLSQCSTYYSRYYLLSESKGESRLLGCLCEQLVLDGEITNCNVIAGHKALHGSTAVLNGELGTVGLVCRRRGRIILGVQEAGDRSALNARDPKVARTVIKVSAWSRAQERAAYPVSRMTLNYEHCQILLYEIIMSIAYSLRWCSQRDLREVLGIHEVWPCAVSAKFWSCIKQAY